MTVNCHVHGAERSHKLQWLPLLSQVLGGSSADPEGCGGSLHVVLTLQCRNGPGWLPVSRRVKVTVLTGCTVSPLVLAVGNGCGHLISLCGAWGGGFAGLDQGQCGDAASTQTLLWRCVPGHVGRRSLQRAAAPRSTARVQRVSASTPGRSASCPRDRERGSLPPCHPLQRVGRVVDSPCEACPGAVASPTGQGLRGRVCASVHPPRAVPTTPLPHPGGSPRLPRARRWLRCPWGQLTGHPSPPGDARGPVPPGAGTGPRRLPGLRPPAVLPGRPCPGAAGTGGAGAAGRDARGFPPALPPAFPR